MIYRPVCTIMAFYMIIMFASSCSSDRKKNSSSASVLPVTNTNPFTLEDAESLAGKYYNQQNQLKNYPYYKSIAIGNIQIDSSYHRDTILITALTTGRTWANPSVDTVTSFFSQELKLKVFRYKQIWWADKLQSPESVNAIPEPVKK